MSAIEKWQSTIKRLEVLPEDKYINDDNVVCCKFSGLVKSNLRTAMHYLWQLDYKGEEYQMPFNRKQFERLLTEPVGKTKLEEAIKIKHTCAKMAGW
ncbi:hypothetical protein [Limosilactobacillus vaginalis]|uniref:hypothetical protein n=1 Tax=Limosilactobacillus vaginalis TaxID=1633 RepID=UPI0024B9B1B5|nr:hypothetical protein [Limosilactobacillus vaginalis]